MDLPTTQTPQHAGAVKRVQLRDGTPAEIQLFEPVSRETAEHVWSELSPESQYHRFLATYPHFTESMYERLVTGVDGVDHVALVLAVLPDEGLDSKVGIARIIRYPEAPTNADVAVTVRDEWHGHGVATLLLEELMRRRPAGVTRLVTQVATDNPASLAMLQRLGKTLVTQVIEGTYQVVVQLPPVEPADDGPAVSPAAR